MGICQGDAPEEWALTSAAPLRVSNLLKNCYGVFSTVARLSKRAGNHTIECY